MFPLYYLPITIDNFGYIPVLACMLFMYSCLWLNYYIQKKKKKKRTPDPLSAFREGLGTRLSYDPIHCNPNASAFCVLFACDGCVWYANRILVNPSSGGSYRYEEFLPTCSCQDLS